MDVITADDCEICGEEETDLEPLGHFWSDEAKEYIIAHGQCGEDAGLPLG